MKTRLKVIDTPSDMSEVHKIARKHPDGTVLVDRRNMGFWVVAHRDAERLFILNYVGVTNPAYSNLNGNRPTNLTGGALNQITRLSDKTNRISFYGILDDECLERVINRMVWRGTADEELKSVYKKLRLAIVGNLREPKEKTKPMEFGVELELESDEYLSCDERSELYHKCSDIVHDIGTDGSVEHGVEIRFNHPSMRGWKMDKIKNVLDVAKDAGLKSEWGTAGMHIHISCKDINKAVNKFVSNLFEMQTILYPIGCRTRKVGTNNNDATYGLGRDIYRDQREQFGTLEIRAWRATTNPLVFKARLRIAQALVDFLLTDLTVGAPEFFKWLPKSRKKDYEFLLNTENPHEYGLPAEAIMTMLK